MNKFAAAFAATVVKKQVINPVAAEFLDKNEAVRAELQEVVNASSAEEINDKIKSLKTNKTYKVKGKKRQAAILTKNQFVELCAEYKSDGLSDEVIEAIQGLAKLNENQAESLQTNLLTALISEV